jgi:hypothetical protein
MSQFLQLHDNLLATDQAPFPEIMVRSQPPRLKQEVVIVSKETLQMLNLRPQRMQQALSTSYLGNLLVLDLWFVTKRTFNNFYLMKASSMSTLRLLSASWNTRRG